MTLGEYLNQTRNERAYTLRDLSARCGVSSAEISRIESGKRKKPAPTVLNSLAGALVLDYTYLLELAGYMPESRQPDQGRKEVYPVGDCRKVGNLRSVIWGAYETAMKI